MIPPGLFAKDLLVVTGKGGVGKTTVAAALGTAAAARGLRTIVAEVAARGRRLQDAARRPPATPLRPARVGGRRRAAPHLDRPRARRWRSTSSTSCPCRRWPNAGVLAALRLPRRRDAGAAGAADRRQGLGARAAATAARRARSRTTSSSSTRPPPGTGWRSCSAPRTFAKAARVGPIARQGRTIDEMLSDPDATGVRRGGHPEEMPVNETLALRAAAARAGSACDVDAVVVNALLPDRLSGAQAGAVRAALSTPARF